MTKSQHHTDRRSEHSGVHRNTYRVLLAIAVVLPSAFGYMYSYSDPSAVDPMWRRHMLGGSALLLLLLSFQSKQVKRHLIALVNGFFYILTTYFIYITAVNQFTPNYSLGLLFTVTAVGVAFSFGVTRPRAITWYLIFTVAATLPALFLAPDLEVSRPVLATALLSTALVIFVVARAKFRAEEAVRESDERYHTLMNAANDAIFIADPETGLLVDANEKAEELIGRSLSDLRLMHYAELFPEEKREPYEKVFERHVFERKPISEVLYVVDSSGRRTPVDISANLVDLGDRTLIQGIFRDATERLRSEEQLIQAKERAEDMLRLKSSFLNNMSHELRTPLTSILGFAKILKDEAPGEQKKYAETINESAERLQKTLNSVLDLVQLESGEATLELRPVDIVHEVKTAVSELQPLAEQKNIDLVSTSTAGSLEAEMDRKCLRRILHNLISNAIKFTDEGRVTVEVSQTAHRIQIRVHDTGIGISDDFMKHLFEEFRQESSGLARNYEGTGLGLAITKRLIDMMGGAIDVASVQGRGSIFTVSFPHMTRRNGQEDAPRSTRQQRRGDDTPTLRLLAAQMDESKSRLLHDLLSPQHELVAVSRAEEALEQADRVHFDMLLVHLDLEKPQPSIDVLNALRTRPQYEHVPAIALTFEAMDIEPDQLRKWGFEGHVSAPFSEKDLMETVRAVTNRLS